MASKSTKVSRPRFEKIAKEARKLFAAHGARLVIRRLKRVPFDPDFETPAIGIAGYFDLKTSTARVAVYGNVPNSKILFVIFHELRHAIHADQGLYPSYYAKKHQDFHDFLRGLRKTAPRNYVPYHHSHLLAELDCNNYAFQSLKTMGIRVTVERYPVEMVFTYGLKQAWEALKKPKNLLTRIDRLLRRRQKWHQLQVLR